MEIKDKRTNTQCPTWSWWFNYIRRSAMRTLYQIFSKQNRQYKHETLMDGWQIL